MVLSPSVPFQAVIVLTHGAKLATKGILLPLILPLIGTATPAHFDPWALLMKAPEKVPAAVSTRLMTSSESRGFFQTDHSGRPSAWADVAKPRASRRQQAIRFMEHSKISMRLFS